VWTGSYMKGSLLYWGLGYYLAFALLHSVLPIVLQRLSPLPKGSAGRGLGLAHMAPLLTLGLLLFAMTVCDILSFAMWPVALLLGMLAIAVAWMAASILSAVATVGLVMACVGVWLFRLPDVAGLPGILTLLGFFACSFFAWGLF